MLHEWNLTSTLVCDPGHICPVPCMFPTPRLWLFWNLSFVIEELMESVIKQLISSYSNSLPVLK